MVVEVVWFRSSTLASIYVFNVGAADLSITKIDVNGDPSTISPTSLSIVPNTGGWINITNTTRFTSGSTYTFNIVTQRGIRIETSATR